MDTDVKDALFLLARHGTTKLNEQDRYRGWADDEKAELDRNGIREAKVAGRFVSKLPIDIGIIYVSDLNRTKHTAAIIASILGIKDIHVDSRLLPIDVGNLVGKKKSKTPIDYYLNNPDEPFPGGESITDFRDRQESFSDDLMTWIHDNPDQKALVVGHLSNVVYWSDLDKSLPGYLKEYASNKEDLINPGGIVMVMPDDKVIPILGENKDRNKDEKL